MDSPFWAKSAGASNRTPWHEFIPQAGVMVPKCNRKSAGRPGRHRFDHMPRMGRICKACAGTSLSGIHRKVSRAMAEEALDMYKSGAFLSDIAAHFNRGITAIRYTLLKESQRQGVDYKAISSRNQGLARKRINEPIHLLEATPERSQESAEAL